MTSTEEGRFRIILLSGVAPQALLTASHTSIAKSSSVAVKVSKLYSKCHSVSGWSAIKCLSNCIEDTAIVITSVLLIFNTSSRKAFEVGLTRCTIARRAPINASTVRLIKGSRAWLRTSILTSSGILCSVINCLTKSKSVCDADGKATSISLKPISHKVWNKRSFLSAFIGSNSA